MWSLTRANSIIQRRISTAQKLKSKDEEIEKYIKCRKDTKLSICLVEDGTVHPCCDPPRVIIIGAGLAGLSAANRLTQCGIDNFVILEATDRPGGRIHSCYMGNIVTEMGATTILGGSVKNPMYALASREGLIPAIANEFPIGRGICMTSKAVAAPKLVNKTASLSMSLIMKQAYELYGKDTGNIGSLWDFMCERIHQESSLYPAKYRKYAARCMLAVTNDYRSKFGADLSKISASQFGSYVPCPGVDVRIPSGMIGALAPLLRNLPTCDHVLYCKSVNKIIWSDKLSGHSDRVKVLCCDGTSYNGDYVILTMSLGYLKENQSIFSPGLPEEKVNAIKKLGYGNCCNIFLEYMKPFWVWKNGTLQLGWSLEELKSRTVTLDWIKGIGTVDETIGSQQSLMVSVADNEADQAEKLSDVKIAEDTTKVLRMFTGDPTLPYPVNVLKSAWKASPFFRGSHAFIPPGCTVEDQCQLGAPVPSNIRTVPTLFFAGEATALGMIGTLHGARMSGVREAERIIELTRLSSGKPRPNLMDSIGWLKQSDLRKAVANN